MANPTRPVQDAIIDPVWGQWVHDDTVRTKAFGWTAFTGTTDAWGYLNIPVALFGLATLAGGVATIRNNPNSADVTFTVSEAAPNAGGTLLVVRCMQLNQTTNDIATLVNLPNIQVSAFAWGTAL